MPTTTRPIPMMPGADSRSPSRATDSGATRSAGVPRAIGYTRDRSPAPYAAVSAMTYAVSNTPDSAISSQPSSEMSRSAYTASTGEASTAPTTSAPNETSARSDSDLRMRFQAQ